MSARSGDDPRSLSPGPAAAQADDGGLTMGLHRQTAHVDDPGVKTHDRLHGVGPSRRPVDGFKRERHVDIRVENCTGLLKNGNCAGDPYWMPPDGAWYTWPGIGGTPTNRNGGTIMAQNPTNPGFDFAGGQTTSNTDLADWNAPQRTTYAVTSDGALTVVKQREVTGFGQGTGGGGSAAYNCYSNCNCNCACVCACDCACDCSTCFPGWTGVTLASGSVKRIDEILPGDALAGFFGESVIVRGVDKTTLGPRYLWRVWGRIGSGPELLVAETTEEHSFWTMEYGFCSIDPDATWAEKDKPQPVIVDAAGTVEHWVIKGRGPRANGHLVPGLHLPMAGDITAGVIKITRVERDDQGANDPATPLYSLVIHDMHQINRSAWVSGWSDLSIDWTNVLKTTRKLFRKRIETNA